MRTKGIPFAVRGAVTRHSPSPPVPGTLRRARRPLGAPAHDRCGA